MDIFVQRYYRFYEFFAMLKLRYT